jgi:hypothetical protein
MVTFISAKVMQNFGRQNILAKYYKNAIDSGVSRADG